MAWNYRLKNRSFWTITDSFINTQIAYKKVTTIKRLNIRKFNLNTVFPELF